MEGCSARPRLMREASSSEFPALDASNRPSSKQVDIWKPKPATIARRGSNQGQRQDLVGGTKDNGDERNHDNDTMGYSYHKNHDNNNARRDSHSRRGIPSSTDQQNPRRCSVGALGHRNNEWNSGDGRTTAFRSTNNNNNNQRDVVTTQNGRPRVGGRQSWAGEARRRCSGASSIHMQSTDSRGGGRNERSRRSHPSDFSDMMEERQRNRAEEEIRKLKPMKLQFWRTKMCPWVTSLGNCRKGESCRYAHTQEELRPLPDLTKTKMCEDYLQTGKCFNPGRCKYAHTAEELRATNSFSKTKLCPRWLLGDCVAGGLCRFAHGEEELRNTSIPLLDDSSDCGDTRHLADGEMQSRRASLSSSSGCSDECEVEYVDYRESAVNKHTHFNRQQVPDNRGQRGRYSNDNRDSMTMQNQRFESSADKHQMPMMASSTNRYETGLEQRHQQQSIPSISVTPSQESQQWSQSVSQQQQQSLVDPTVFFQGLSPMSLRVATNALVYLSELQHTWPNNGGSQAANDARSPQQPISPPMTEASTNDSHPQQQHYASMIYPQSPSMQPAAVWGSLNGAPNIQQVIQGAQPTMMQNQPANQQQPQQQHIIGGTPLRYFSQNMTFSANSPMNRPPGFSPLAHSGSIDQSGTETGRFVTTHLLPSGMFSPMTQRSFRTAIASSKQGNQQLMKGSQQPIDLFLSFPSTAQGSSSTSPDFNEQTTTTYSDGNVAALNSSAMSSANANGHFFASAPTSHQATSQMMGPQLDASGIPHPSTVPNAHHLAWNNSNGSTAAPQVMVSPTPYIFPVECQNNNNNSNSSPGSVFLSASSTGHHPAQSSAFSSPLPSTQPHPLQQSGSLNSACLSPASYATAVSYPNGITSPTTAILTTLNLLSGHQQVPHNSHDFLAGPYHQRPSEMDSPVIPGFPLLAYLASQPAQQSDSMVMTNGVNTKARPLMLTAGQVEGMRHQQQISAMSKAGFPTPQFDNDKQNHHSHDYPQQPHQQHPSQGCSSSSSPLEHSPSLFSSKSSSERTSTGSPSTTATATTNHSKVGCKAILSSNA